MNWIIPSHLKQLKNQTNIWNIEFKALGRQQATQGSDHWWDGKQGEPVSLFHFTATVSKVAQAAVHGQVESGNTM